MTLPSFSDAKSAQPSLKYTLVFDEFFDLGLEETLSPFLTPDSRRWSFNLQLKSALFSAVLLVLAFALSWNSKTLPLSHLFLVGVYFFAGVPSLIESIEDLSNYEINIDILMTLAAFSSVLIGSGMEGGLLLVLFAISGAMEEAVTAKAKGAISHLHKLSPTKACVVGENGRLVEKSVKEIEVNTLILVKSGQVVPLDGTVIKGISSVNMVHLTGENLPVTKQEGDQIAAGAQNMEGALTVRVTHTNADSTLSRIIKLVTQAQEARPALQRWFDKTSRLYAMTIILLSTFFASALPFLLNIPFLGADGSVYRALAFLIAASPCALIIAIPIAYLSAVSACAKKGIVLKGGISLDALASCHAVAFDKTGTLTTGELSFIAIEGLNSSSVTSEKAFAVAYALEKNAVHPIAKAILLEGERRNVAEVEIKEFKSVPGYGLEALVVYDHKEQSAYIGRPEYLLSLLEGDHKKELEQRIREIESQGELLAVMLIGGEITIFRFRDTIRSKIELTLQNLRQFNMHLIMLTGDHAHNAARVANELGIHEYFADLRPEDKLEYVDRLAKSQGLAMIGDGVNDAPALARATVGICMGKVGSSTAVAAADIVLLHDNIELLDWLVKKAKQTQRIVSENLILASAAILLASLPALGGLIPLWLAVVLHEGGTVLVGLNGLRLLR